MNRTVKFLLALLTLTFSFTVPCLACYDENEDDFYDYYTLDTDGDGVDDLWVVTDEDGHGIGYGYYNDEGLFECILIERSDNEADDDGKDDECGDDDSDEDDVSIDDVENEDEDIDNENEEIGDDDKSLSRYKKHKLADLKKDYLIKKIKRELPDKFVPQDNGSSQCTARAIATAEQLCGGDYNSAYETAMELAEKAEHYLNKKGNGIAEDDMVKTYQDYCDITREPFSSKEVDDHMDKGEVVFGIIDTDSGAHMVTIVGSDTDYFYCASGFEEAQQIPKDDFKDYDIFVYNGKKTPYK